MRAFFEKNEFMKVVLVFLLVLIATGTMYLSERSKLRELRLAENTLMDERVTLLAEIAEMGKTRDDEITTITKDVSGVDLSLLESDKPQIEAFFAPAFDWKNGNEYEAVRNHYEEVLGEDNKFTSTYLPPDYEVDGGELGTFWSIDIKEIKARYRGMNLVPLSGTDREIRYALFVTYHMYKDEKDLGNIDALKPSQAILMFTMKDGVGEVREITDVIAWPGFTEVGE